jgi:hypothetical protein
MTWRRAGAYETLGESIKCVAAVAYVSGYTVLAWWHSASWRLQTYTWQHQPQATGSMSAQSIAACYFTKLGRLPYL